MTEDIRIFCDGASKGNPGPGGFGAIVKFDSFVKEIGGAEAYTTNNRMELTAAIEAFRFISSGTQFGGASMAVYCDSAYVVNGITKWVYGWQKNGWQTAQKKPVENQDLWAALLDLIKGKTVEWQQVAGHADTPGNARCDEIASAFAEGGSPALFDGTVSEYRIDLSKIGATGKRGPAFYVSIVDGVAMRHVTWKECEARVKGKSAKFKKVFSDDEERVFIALHKK